MTLRWHLPRSLLIVAILALFVGGCSGRPNQANIQLRKENQQLRDQIASLTRERNTARAEVEGLKERQGTLPTLPAERLDRLFTVSGIRLGRLTGPSDLDPSTPGNEGLKVYVTPIDGAGQKLKAAGSFVVEAFDLAAEENRRVGRWEFDVEQAKESWMGVLMRYEYVLICPWEKPPANPELTVKVTFIDELTGRRFTEQTVVKARPAAGAS